MGPEGAYLVFENDQDMHGNLTKSEVPSLKKYFQDLDFILNVVSDGPTKSFAYRRLRYLESKYQLYTLLNEHQEQAECKVRSL
jgi:AMP deaminase